MINIFKRLLSKPVVSGVVINDNKEIIGVIAPNNSPNRLDLLCKKYNATYTIRRNSGVVFLKLHLKDETVLAAQATNTQEAISLLTIQAEKWHLTK